MVQAIVEGNKLKYKKMLKTYEVDTKNFVWGYLQQEDASARLCCGTASFPIGRLVLLDNQGKKEIFQYEGLDEPRKLLEAIKASNPEMAVGYTEENRARFEGN